ncbi:MAG: M48 family metalloprotease [Rhodobacteraceae bacterium]|nr:M48 family metalloprotease [Paracoccaceae bacterium]
MLRLLAFLGIAAALAACDTPTAQAPGTAGAQQAATTPDALRTSQAAAAAFSAVQARLEPVAERECRQRTSGVNCDFRIAVDTRPDQPANAFQTLDNGRPLIVFTVALIEQARNEDEIAFVMGHEAAHHIEGHLARQQQNAVTGAVIFAGLATLTGADTGAVQNAQRLGATVGARTYSKDFELEADRLGTIITDKAGYDPLRGSQFFNRIPDPGNRFLGTHPPNAQRLEVVRQTASQL